VVAVLLGFAVSVGWAQGEADPGRVPEASAVEAIIGSISTGLDQVYVFPDTAEKMVALIEKQRATGGYDGLSYMELAEALTRDLQSVSHDKHLVVRFDPSALEPAIDHDDNAWWAARLAEDNYGFRTVRRLDGNVGYLELTAFAPAEVAGDVAVAAMNFLARSRALIVDLRHNGGGDPSMIQLISSYLFSEPVHLNDFYIRKSDTTRQFWTPAHVEGPRMADVPVYVLTSKFTFSGAEEFSYNLKNLERATLVGETTGGGAHPVQLWTVDGYPLSMSLPYGRAVNPITGTNWEGTGVEPNVPVAAEDALSTAHVMALEKIAASDELEDWVRAGVEWALTGVRAAAEPYQLAPDDLDAYAGSFGARTVRRDGDRLFYQRGGMPPLAMRPLAADLFGFDEVDFFRIRFERDDTGKITGLVGLYADGRTDASPREP